MASNSPLNISMDNSKYLISLDSLDLHLLPSTYTPRLNAKPVLLWQTKNLDLYKDEYLEFEIRGSSEFPSPENESYKTYDGPEIKDDISTDLCTNEIHIVCHICKILVPKAYIKDHEKSSKHKSYQKIATTAIERQMNQKSFKKAKEQLRTKNNYFCEHCASIVKVKDREDHEISMKHKNFVALDSFLTNFANFYTNSDENVDEKLSKIVIGECNKSDIYTSFVKVNKKTDINVHCVPKVNNTNKDTTKEITKDESVIDNKLKEAVNLINNIESCIENTCKEINNNVNEVNDFDENEEANVVNSLKQYIKLVKKYGTVKLEPLNSIDQDRVRIETQDGCELVVSVNNFHGFKRTGRKYVQCKMCKLFVSNVNDHIITEKHLKIIAQPFGNRHCLRMVTDVTSYCVVCNEVVDNPAVHILFNEHSKKLEQTLVPKVDNMKTSIQKESIEDINEETRTPKSIKPEVSTTITDNGNTSKNNNNFEATVKDFKREDSDSDGSKNPNEQENTKRTNNNQHFCSTCNKFMHVNNIETHINGTKHIMNSKTANNYLMERIKNGLKCRICESYVQIFTWAVDDHIASPEHIINYYKFLAENKINQTFDGFFCKPCAKGLPKSSEVIHVSTQSHKIRLVSFNINYIASIDHQKAIDNTSRPIKDIISLECGDDSNTSTIYDNEATSKLEVQGLNEGISTQGVSKEIAKKMKTKINLNDTYQCDVCNETIFNDPERIKLHNESANHKIMHELLSKVNNLLEELLKYFKDPPETHYHLERTDVESELKCKVCRDKVKIEDAEKHISSLKHLHNHRTLMDVNKLKLKDDKYICQACNVYVENCKELHHINTEQHEERMESLRNGDYVLVTITAKKLIEKISDDLKVVESQKGNPKAKDLEFGDFIPWQKGVELKSGTNYYNHFSNLIDKDDELICILCQVVVANAENELISHINNSNHLSNYNDVMTYNQIYKIKTGFVCGFCESTFIDNEFGHILSSQHEKSYTNDPKKNFCFKCNVSTIHLDLKDHLTNPQHIKAINSESHSLHYCNICNLKLTNSESNIQRHIDGFQHKNNDFLIEQNKVILKNKKCFCQVCEKIFSRDSLNDHINSSNHIMLLDGN